MRFNENEIFNIFLEKQKYNGTKILFSLKYDVDVFIIDDDGFLNFVKLNKRTKFELIYNDKSSIIDDTDPVFIIDTYTEGNKLVKTDDGKYYVISKFENLRDIATKNTEYYTKINMTKSLLRQKNMPEEIFTHIFEIL
jgi:hypothetical protein